MSKLIIPIIIIVLSIILLFCWGCSKKKEDSKFLKYFEARTFKQKLFQKPLLYRLYVPEGYTPNKQYPLILYLHGGGGNGNDNKSQISVISGELISPAVQSIQKSFILIPQCPKGKQWLNTTFKTTPYTNYDQDEIPEGKSMKMIIEAIDELQKEFNIDNKRLYVTGYSMGGSGTWDIITRYPDIFAAAVPLTGVSDPSKASLISGMPIWAFHGRKDNISLVENTRNMIRELKKLKSKCKFTEYEDVSHDVWSYAYYERELFIWLFSNRKE